MKRDTLESLSIRLFFCKRTGHRESLQTHLKYIVKFEFQLCLLVLGNEFEKVKLQ